MKAVGFPNEPKSKMAATYCFRADPELGIKIAARRFHCNCKGCSLEMESAVGERYNGIGRECQYWDIFRRGDDRGWNGWSILSFEGARGYEKDAHDEMTAHTVECIATLNARLVKVGNCGSYAVDDGEYRYYMVRWTCEPWQVKEDEIVKVENTSYSLFQNEWICRGRWFDCVPSTTEHWFTEGEQEVIVRMKHVLMANVPLDQVSDSNKLPKLARGVKEQLKDKCPQKLEVECHNFLMEEAHRREELDHEEDQLEGQDSEDDSDDESNDEEDDEIDF